MLRSSRVASTTTTVTSGSPNRRNPVPLLRPCWSTGASMYRQVDHFESLPAYEKAPSAPAPFCPASSGMLLQARHLVEDSTFPDIRISGEGDDVIEGPTSMPMRTSFASCSPTHFTLFDMRFSLRSLILFQKDQFRLIAPQRNRRSAHSIAVGSPPKPLISASIRVPGTIPRSISLLRWSPRQAGEISETTPLEPHGHEARVLCSS